MVAMVALVVAEKVLVETQELVVLALLAKVMQVVQALQELLSQVVEVEQVRLVTQMDKDLAEMVLQHLFLAYL
jgi:DNA transposition AAA+ family ATPase